MEHLHEKPSPPEENVMLEKSNSMENLRGNVLTTTIRNLFTLHTPIPEGRTLS